MFKLDNMPTQPQKRWLRGPLQVPTLLSPRVVSCGEWASPGPPWAGGVPRPCRPGLYWAPAKPSSEEATWPQSPARALQLSPALPGAWKTHHLLKDPCVDAGGRTCLWESQHSCSEWLSWLATVQPLMRPFPAPHHEPCSLQEGPALRAIPPASEGQGPSRLAEPLNTPGRPGCRTGGKEMLWGWDREQE